MRIILCVLLGVATARAQDTSVIRACDQPATIKLDAAFYGDLTTIPAADSAAVGPVYLENVLEAIRESLRPGPLALNEYLVVGNQAMLAAEMTVVFTVTREGQVRDVGLASSSLSSAFDRMIVDAIHAADTSGLMPPLPSDAPSHVEFMLDVFTNVFFKQATAAFFRRPGHVQALLETSLPGWTVAVKPAEPDSNGLPAYPNRARLVNLQDSVLVRFAIDENGRGVPASVFVSGGRYRDFAKSARDWLSTAHFKPARIGTCAVKSIERQPFSYTLQR